MTPGGLLLAVETATRMAGVALLRAGEPLAELSLAPERPVSETLLPGIESLLGEAGASLDCLAALAVSIGPGSFTGLRVGLATVKGLAFEPELPAIPVSSLEALARTAAPAEFPLAALLDAQRGQVYAAMWSVGEALEGATLPEGLYDPEALATRLPAGCALVGEGAAVALSALSVRPGPPPRVLPAPPGAERARALGRIGAERLARGEGRPAGELVPRYLRRAEAEARRTGLSCEGTGASGSF